MIESISGIARGAGCTSTCPGLSRLGDHCFENQSSLFVSVCLTSCYIIKTLISVSYFKLWALFICFSNQVPQTKN